jgi:hypothetical protein
MGYVLVGRRDNARKLFERLLLLRNDLGLLSEEYDPDAKRLLGNFPQAFSHIALGQYAAQHRAASRSRPFSDRNGTRFTIRTPGQEWIRRCDGRRREVRINNTNSP